MRNSGKKRPRQIVRDNAGRMVGHVPANLCGVLKSLLVSGHVNSITCVMTGTAMASVKPATQEKYRRNPYGGRDSLDGGGVIPCQYELHVKTGHVSVVRERVGGFLRSANLTEKLM